MPKNMVYVCGKPVHSLWVELCKVLGFAQPLDFHYFKVGHIPMVIQKFVQALYSTFPPSNLYFYPCYFSVTHTIHRPYDNNNYLYKGE